MELTDNSAGGIWIFDDIELPETWAFDQLGNHCTVRRGASPRPAGSPRYFGGGTIPWIKIGDATKTGSRYIESTEEHVNEAGAKCSVHIPAGSLIIANSGVSLGFAAITRVPGCIHDGWLLATDFRGLDRDYLYYCINIATQRLRGLADGTTQPNLNTGIARRLILPFPPLAEQESIASVLGTLDDLIELNRETNEILEEMARALFKSWFVDFDPVRAKLEGRPPAGMDAATAALFPDHFQDSELGQIPRGWEVVTLGSVLDTLETGRRPKGGVAGYSSGVPSVGAESINGIGVFDFSKTKFIPHEFYEKTISGRVQNLDVLLYKDGGKPGEFRPRVGLYGYGFPFDEFSINEHVFRMRADAVGQHYLYFAIADERVLLDFANKGGKAAIPGINQTDVRSTVIVLPPKSILDEFERQAQPICQSIIENFAESRDLAALRDTLLPKLLSGEVKAPATKEVAR